MTASGIQRHSACFSCTAPVSAVQRIHQLYSASFSCTAPAPAVQRIHQLYSASISCASPVSIVQRQHQLSSASISLTAEHPTDNLKRVNQGECAAPKSKASTRPSGNLVWNNKRVRAQIFVEVIGEETTIVSRTAPASAVQRQH
jgi:hypothetical protein